MNKNALVSSKRLEFSSNNQTHKNFIAQPRISLKSFKNFENNILKQNLRWVPLNIAQFYVCLLDTEYFGVISF